MWHCFTCTSTHKSGTVHTCTSKFVFVYELSFTCNFVAQWLHLSNWPPTGFVCTVRSVFRGHNTLPCLRHFGSGTFTESTSWKYFPVVLLLRTGYQCRLKTMTEHLRQTCAPKLGQTRTVTAQVRWPWPLLQNNLSKCLFVQIPHSVSHKQARFISSEN